MRKKKCDLPKKLVVYREYDEKDKAESWLCCDEDYSPDNYADKQIVGHYELKAVAMVHKTATETKLSF